MGKLIEVREAIAACFRANAEPLTKAQVFAWIDGHYPDNKFNQNTLQAQLYRSCVQSKAGTAPKILDYNSKTRTYKLRDDVSTDSMEDILDPGEQDDDQGDSTFVLEAHLQAYLVKNLSSLEKGVKLWCEAPPSVEYAIGGKRIDILARDSQGVPVVIEVKLNRGYDRVVGQALLYQALLMNDLKVGRVRIMLVANDISPDLKMACSRLADVELFEYAITMKIDRVSSVLTEEEVLDVSSR